MGEVKSVKVDNWGVFFLQKLQNFFNKTDYCDLTLQFNDNSQLKVHRLVLSACTDYFNVLEQTCEMIDDILIMPRELQADVVVPIVNFMYTGTLEFEINMYTRLMKTARDMNMTVLLKLLEAHKKTFETPRMNILNRTPGKILNLTPKRVGNMYGGSQRQPVRVVEKNYGPVPISNTNQQRRVNPQTNVQQYKQIHHSKQSTSSTSIVYTKTLPEPAAIVTKFSHSRTPVKGPSRFECVDETVMPLDSFESSFDNISYESKPLITANQICKEEPEMDDYDNVIRGHSITNTHTSTFEQLRRGYTNNPNKRAASSSSSLGSPPDKKPNIEDVKEYAEQQRMRKQIAAEYDDENHDYDDVLDDEFQNDDDDEDYIPPSTISKQVKTAAYQYKQQQQQQQQQQKKQQEPELPKKEIEKKSTIVVKDSGGSNVNHAKIISEVLKKYPHLVKSNKNIKLKILPKSSSTQPTSTLNTSASPQKIVIKEEPCDYQDTPMTQTSKTDSIQSVKKEIATPPSVVSAAPVQTPTTIVAQPKRIDSKTMHALIALGAENMTGPWLCLRCGVNGRPISIPSYRGFRRHLINTHKEKIDARICEHCGWRATNHRELYHHMLIQHGIQPPNGYSFPKCEHCSQILLDSKTLEHHISTIHPDVMDEQQDEQQHCIYCNKIFSNEIHLYAHMRNKHKERAQDDGIIDFSDDDLMDDDKDSQQLLDGSEKIKILSNITLPKNPIIEEAVTLTQTKLKRSTEAEGLSNVATGIATSLTIVDNANVIDDSHILSGQYIEEEITEIPDTFNKKEPKFVTADGNVMDLTPEQREEIISQLGNQDGGVLMVLNQDSFVETEEVETSATIQTATKTEDFFTEDRNILVMYNEDGTSITDKTKDTEISTETTLKGDVLKALSETDSQLDWPEDSVSQTSTENISKNNETDNKMDESNEKSEIEDTLAEMDRDSEDVNISKEQEHVETSDEETAEEKTNKKKTPKKIKENKRPEKVSNTKKKEVKTNIDKLKLLTGDWSDDDVDDDGKDDNDDTEDNNNKGNKDEENTDEDHLDKITDEKEKPPISVNLKKIVERNNSVGSDQPEIVFEAIAVPAEEKKKATEKTKKRMLRNVKSPKREIKSKSSNDHKQQIKEKLTEKTTEKKVNVEKNKSQSTKPKENSHDDEEQPEEKGEEEKHVKEEEEEKTYDKAPVKSNKVDVDDNVDDDDDDDNENIDDNEDEIPQTILNETSGLMEELIEESKNKERNDKKKREDKQSKANTSASKEDTDDSGLITKADIKELISDWGDDDDDEI